MQPGNFKDAIADILRQRVAQQADRPGFRQAAVLLPLYQDEAGPHLVLTKRTELVPTHKVSDSTDKPRVNSKKVMS